MSNESAAPVGAPARGSDVTTVLFDLDDTLCRPEPPFSAVLEDMFVRAGVEPFFDATDYRRWLPRVEADDPEDLLERIFAALVEEAGRDPDLARTLVDAYEEPDDVDFRFRPGAEAALDALDERYALGLVTNGSEAMQSPKLSALGIADRFEATVFATPETALKPDPEPFRRALDALDAAPAETVHVGNSLRADVAGARAAGIRSVWVPVETSPRDGPEAEYVLESMRELAVPPWESG